jgi:predicted secreted protein
MVINGNEVGLSIGSQLIGCLTNATFSSTNETIDVTCKDNNGARQSLPGGNTATITFEGFFDPASTFGVGDLLPLHKNKTEINWHFGDNENLTMHGLGFIDVLEFTGPLNAGTTFSGTINVTGEWEYTES